MRHLETFPLVRMFDPALEGADPADVMRYARTRDPDDIPSTQAAPVVFHCRRLSRSQVFGFVEPAPNESLKFARAFAAGVVRVTGGAFGEEPGWSPADARRADYLAMQDDEIDTAGGVGFAPAEIMEIGAVIYQRSVSPKGCEQRYRPLPSSLAVWEGLALRTAEQTPADAPPSSGRPNEG